MTQWLMARTGVLIAAITGGTMIVLAFVGGLVFLAYKGADASTVLSLMAAIVTVINYAQIRSLSNTVTLLKEQTNGTTNKLIEAAIKAPASE